MEYPQLKQERFASLDYLRGLMALAVLVFHYDKWLTGTWDAASLQGRLGVYAVSIFFVLSGITLTLVYENRLDGSLRTWASFFRKRFWRIFPLLWLATAATLLLDGSPRPASIVFLNFTGLFGFVNPAQDIATGAWSIGCELVFYAAFPILLLLSKKSRAVFALVFLMVFAFGAWAAFAWFPSEKSSQAEWWEAYTQVGNHAFFFMGGMAMGVFRNELEAVSPRFWRVLLVLAAIAFAVWPIGSEPFHLVSGWNRVVFSTLVMLAVAAFWGGGRGRAGGSAGG
ncbi:MAG: acyltransferase family protein, partial [Saprospiraceae bacterium]